MSPKPQVATKRKLVDQPWFSHVMLLGTCIVLITLLHLPLLFLPYYWDEAGYYIPAAHDLYVSGSLVPHSTVANPHPPLLSMYLAAAWKLFGFSPFVTRVAVSVIAGAAIYAVLLLATLLVPAAGGLWAALLTALTPVFFAQSTLAHLDVAATLGTVLCLYFYLRRRVVACAVGAALLCLARETGLVVVLTLAGLELWEQLRARRQAVDAPGTASPANRRAMRNVLMLLAALLPLAAWFVLLRWKTGLWLGDREFANYNLWGVMNPVRWLMQLGKRFYQFFIADFRWVASLLIFLAVRAKAWAPVAPSPATRRQRPAERPQFAAARHHFKVLFIVGAVYLAAMSVLGGAPLTRYLLPIFPLLFLFAAHGLLRIPRLLRTGVAFALPAAFVVCWFWNPVYPFGYEENLAYADFVRIQQAGVRMLAQLPPDTRILTAWPASDELVRPWLGYVSSPMRVVRIGDFSQEELSKLSGDEFDAVLFFSRQWNPEWFEHHPLLTRIQARYFGYRPQVAPSYLAGRFGLQLGMRTEIRGQWVEIWVKTRIRPIDAEPVRVENKRLITIPFRYLTCKSEFYGSASGQSDPA